MKLRIVIIAILFTGLFGCGSEYYQKNVNLTFSSEANKGFPQVHINQEYDCAPNLIALKADGAVEVDWGDDTSNECGKRSQSYSFTFDGDNKYTVTAEDQSHHIKIVEMESHVYGAKKLGNNPVIVYIIAN